MGPKGMDGEKGEKGEMGSGVSYSYTQLLPVPRMCIHVSICTKTVNYDVCNQCISVVGVSLQGEKGDLGEKGMKGENGTDGRMGLPGDQVSNTL